MDSWRDLELLASLVKEGKVMRVGPATTLSLHIDKMNRINLAIRPKKKGKKK